MPRPSHGRGAKRSHDKPSTYRPNRHGEPIRRRGTAMSDDERPPQREQLPLFYELCSALQAVFGENKRLDHTIEHAFRSRRRKWTDAERQEFVTTLHDTVRAWRWRWHLAGLPERDFLRATAVNQDSIRCALKASGSAHGDESPALRYSYPDWLWQRFENELGSRWEKLAEQFAKPASLFLRTNPLRATLSEVKSGLATDRIHAEPVPGMPHALRVAAGSKVFTSNLFFEGCFEVQDAGSQRIAPIVGAAPGMRVVDACAGAGGKSLHLAALMQNKGKLIALDTHEWKLAELKKRAARAGVDNLEARLLDSHKPLKRLESSADRVLLDVPCSGLGVLRRHPDRKWHITSEELDRLTTLQAELLRDYSRMVKPGGALIYATCSILPSENEQQVKAFLAGHPGWKLDHEESISPAESGGDAFYAARILAPGK